ncbi:hypothetical protein [Sphingobacterium faecium]|uniref:hypothetical protein n=1 Tax=Sphingobacterium faecium TaxID=34087 RepID=UPI00320876B1
MNEKSTGWLYELEETLHPNRLNFDEVSTSQMTSLIKELKKEIRNFRPYYILQLGGPRKNARTALLQVIIVSDTIHNYLVTMTRSYSNNPLFQKITQFYRQVLLLLELLVEDCGRFDKEILSGLPLTAYSIPNTRLRLREKIDTLRKKIAISNIDTELAELLFSGLQILILRQGMNRSEADYAATILENLDRLETCSTHEVENLLYQYDFNTPSFFNFCANRCNNLLLETSSLHEQFEILIGLEDRINGLPARSTSRWKEEDESIREQLRTFYKEKKIFIRQKIKMRRSELQDSELAENKDRMQINLPVAQFGLFIRLFMEKGLLPKENVGKIFAYYARHFRTPNTPFISAENLQRKSSVVEFTTAKKIKGHLIGMVNWLNEHYNTNNHKDS